MQVSSAERAAIRQCIEIGKAFGFGNMICHLQTAWARSLIDQYGLDVENAREATAQDGRGYPFKMQEDILDRGMWDETGSNYRST